MIRKREIALILSVLVLAGVFFLYEHFLGAEEGDCVVVELNGEEYASYQLNQDGEYRIETENGYNILKIQEGKADMIDADCRDKICVKEKPASMDGQTIVCLPHKVVVTVRSSREKEIDGVAR